MMAFIATSVWKWKRSVAIANACKRVGQIVEMPGDQVDDVAFTLDPAIDPQHAAAENGATVLLEDFRPEDQVGDACFVVKRVEHDAFRPGATCDLM